MQDAILEDSVCLRLGLALPLTEANVAAFEAQNAGFVGGFPVVAWLGGLNEAEEVSSMTVQRRFPAWETRPRAEKLRPAGFELRLVSAEEAEEAIEDSE